MAGHAFSSTCGDGSGCSSSHQPWLASSEQLIVSGRQKLVRAWRCAMALAAACLSAFT